MFFIFFVKIFAKYFFVLSLRKAFFFIKARFPLIFSRITLLLGLIFRGFYLNLALKEHTLIQIYKQSHNVVNHKKLENEKIQKLVNMNYTELESYFRGKLKF